MVTVVTFQPGAARSITISVSVCMSVCLCVYVCSLAYLKNYMSKIHEIYVLLVVVARSSGDNSAVCYAVVQISWMTVFFT